MTCCFFGHRDTPPHIANQLAPLLLRLVEEMGVDRFLVGSEGAFDRMVTAVLAEYKKEHPTVRCYTVLAYMPQKQGEPFSLETIYPEGLESVPRRFAIDRRNKWMLKQSDITVGYVRNSIGNAPRYLEMAKKSGKTVIRLADEV